MENKSGKVWLKQARSYAEKVIKSQKKNPIACIHVINACKRFVHDVDKRKKEFRVDENEIQKWCNFLSALQHVKGKWAANGEYFKLSDWQVFCVVNIFGFYSNKTGRRRFRDVYIEVPRKNGKSFFISGIGLGMLMIDGEYGAEVYCGATTEKQAWEIFGPAKKICERDPEISEHYGVTVNAKTLAVLSNGSKFEPVIGNPGDGASPSCGIADEFHEHATSDLVDTFVTGMGARDNPLMIHITTAGSDMGGPCYTKRSEVIGILSGAMQGDDTFAIIYGLDDGDDWDTIDAQKKANPNYGISVDDDFLKGQLDQARRSPIKQAAYKTKHLNIWVGAKSAWMNMLAFQACRKKDMDIQKYNGKRCFIGIDLASKTDIASMAICFPIQDGVDKAVFFVRHYLPEDTILDGGNTRYKGWHASGWITATPGNVIDYSYIEDDLDELKTQYEIIEVAYDPFQATQFATRAIDRGFPMVEYGQTVKNFSEPMKELEAMILKKSAIFTMCPVLMWMFGNVVAKLDKKDNIFPDKERPENKIDGVVAIIMTVARSLLREEIPAPRIVAL